MAQLGAVVWTHFGEYSEVWQNAALHAYYGIPQVRLGLSWADHCREDGEAWTDFCIKTYAQYGFKIMLNITFTPPSLSEDEQRTCCPPKHLRDYADFCGWIIEKYGKYFDKIQFGNEFNNWAFWDRSHDPYWHKFSEMVRMAAFWAKACGKTTVLGGISPADPNVLEYIDQSGALQHMDYVSFHGFPGTQWSENWQGWQLTLDLFRQKLQELKSPANVIIGEAGVPIHGKCTGQDQLRELKLALATDAETVYWYTIGDNLALHHKSQSEINLGAYDPIEYCYGPGAPVKQYLMQRAGKDKPFPPK